MSKEIIPERTIIQNLLMAYMCSKAAITPVAIKRRQWPPSTSVKGPAARPHFGESVALVSSRISITPVQTAFHLTL